MVEQFNMREYIKNGSDWYSDNVENAYTRPELSTEYEAPSNEIEERIAEIWQSILGIEPVGIKDNFFELGGESLLFVNMHNELEKHYPGKTKVEEIITCPTISEIAAISKTKMKTVRKIVRLNPMGIRCILVIGDEDV